MRYSRGDPRGIMRGVTSLDMAHFARPFEDAVYRHSCRVSTTASG